LKGTLPGVGEMWLKQGLNYIVKYIHSQTNNKAQHHNN